MLLVRVSEANDKEEIGIEVGVVKGRDDLQRLRMRSDENDVGRTGVDEELWVGRDEFSGRVLLVVGRRGKGGRTVVASSTGVSSSLQCSSSGSMTSRTLMLFQSRPSYGLFCLWGRGGLFRSSWNAFWLMEVCRVTRGEGRPRKDSEKL